MSAYGNVSLFFCGCSPLYLHFSLQQVPFLDLESSRLDVQLIPRVASFCVRVRECVDRKLGETMSRSDDMGSFAPTGLEFQLGKTSGEAKVRSVPPKHDPVFKPVAGEPLRPHLFDSYHDTPTDQEPEVAQMLQQAPFINNMVLELPVPPCLYKRVVPVANSLLERNSSPRRNEFSHTRYSAATCDPRSFAHSGFTLRQPLFIQPRQTEICIAITMYNEDESLLGLTLASIHHNIDYLQKLQNDETWGPHSWRKVVICIIIDGRAKINPRTKALLACLGIYQDFGRLESYNGKDVVAHIFEVPKEL